MERKHKIKAIKNDNEPQFTWEIINEIKRTAQLWHEDFNKRKQQMKLNADDWNKLSK